VQFRGLSRGWRRGSVEEAASETLGSGGRCSWRVRKPGQRTSCIVRLASDTTRGPDDFAELINHGEEALCGLELVHDGSNRLNREDKDVVTTLLSNSGRSKQSRSLRHSGIFWNLMASCCRFACSLLDVRLAGRSLSLPNGCKFLGLVSADGLLQSHLFKSCSIGPIQSATAACRARSHQLSGRLLAATDVLMTGGQAIQNNCAGCHTDARSGAARFFRASPEGVC
jgi:hypothetical protein